MRSSSKLRERIREEEGVLLALMERRRQLVEETELLEERRIADRPLPSVPAGSNISANLNENEAEDRLEEEDLIDIASGEQGVAHTFDSVPLALATGAGAGDEIMSLASLEHTADRR